MAESPGPQKEDHCQSALQAPPGAGRCVVLLSQLSRGSKGWAPGTAEADTQKALATLDELMDQASCPARDQPGTNTEEK